MALLNKLLFPSRKSPHIKKQDVSEEQFTFNEDQVRLLLFRECDFRGRKLLFDSDSVEKVVIDKLVQPEKFAEISNGYGYLYTKSSTDYNQISEMVFGSVAMSFRGTYFKIHSLSSPSRLMFTQVFPSPRSAGRKRLSISSQHSRISSRSFEHSFKLDDSGQSSTTSMSERLSDRSTASDTVLVCRRHRSSPLDDVPNGTVSAIASAAMDSGCVDQSFSSVSTCPISSAIWESVFLYKGVSTFSSSSCNLLRRMLRSSSRSLEHSGSSLTGSGSTDNCAPSRPHCRQSKLGLVFVLKIPPEKERTLTAFFMEHVALIEAMIWRTRNAVQFAYHRPTTFVSVMMEIAHTSAQWLADLLNGPRILKNLWQFVSTGCDNLDRFTKVFTNSSGDKNERTLTTSTSVIDMKAKSEKKGLTNSFNGFSLPKLDRPDFFSGFGRFLKTEWDAVYNRKVVVSSDNNGFSVENFLKEFCEVLEVVDVKDTNFFMSTLLTAILTHHLGWVATCLPTSNADAEVLNNIKNPYNPLWGQLSDLFGAAGHPAKTAQTIITGTNKNDMISRILNILTYFIRCGSVERKSVERCDISNENKKAEIICYKNDSIPQENYKKYEDHLKDMLTNVQFGSSIEKSTFKCVEDVNKNTFTALPPSLKKATTHKQLSDLTKNLPQESVVPKNSTYKMERKSTLAKVTSFSNLNQLETPEELSSNEQIDKQLSDLTKNLPQESVVPRISNYKIERKSTLAKVTSFSNLNQLETPEELSSNEQIEVNDAPTNVTFVLGENEELVGLKKDSLSSRSKSYSGSLKKRPTSLCLPKINGNLRIGEKKPVVTARSFESLPEKLDDDSVNDAPGDAATCSKTEKPFCRSQSEPPEEQSSQKFQYSRVKFDLQRYPQVVTNYMKSKNLELSDLPLDGKSVKFSGLSCVTGNVKIDFTEYGSDGEEVETLQTPSNASELEFTSDLGPPESTNEVGGSGVLRFMESNRSARDVSRKMKIVNIPMPLSTFQEIEEVNRPLPYVATVIKGLVDNYMPDMVLQGTTDPKDNWDYKLKSNLALTSEHSLLDQVVEESVAIVANTDTWEVEVISSHTFVTDKEASGIRVGMSQLVASMLESLLHMWKLQMPPQYCIMHIERRLQELCIRSKALAQLLLGTEFCTMELLTSSLHLEVNDVPLLLAVASTHTPQVTQKYGLSFQ